MDALGLSSISTSTFISVFICTLSAVVVVVIVW